MRQLAALLIWFLATSVAADIVYLDNGRVFEGVIAEHGDGVVRVQLASGTITLPASRITRIEPAASPLAEYQERRSRLDVDEPSQSGDWLQLARWASARKLSAAAREAALTAARLDPGAEGLAALLHELGHVQDPETGTWMRFEELQRARGLVRQGGEWVRRELIEERWREEQQARRDRRREERLDRLTDLVEVSVLARLAEGQQPPPSAAQAPAYAFPVAVFPGFHARTGPRVSPLGPGAPRPVTYAELATRLPGSNIPPGRFPRPQP